MPRVPTYSGPQVQSAALQGGMQDAGAYTAGTRQVAQFGQALGQVGDVLDRAAMRDDDTNALQAETTIKAGWMTKDAELRSKYRGSNTDGYLQEVEGWWAGAAQEAAASLSPRARQRVGQSLGAAKLQAFSAAQNYFNAERDRAEVEAFNSAKATEIQRGLTDGRPEAIATSRQILRQHNATQAALRGWTPEQMELENIRDLTTLHTQHIRQLMDMDQGAARTYFDANRNEIDAGNHRELEKAIDKAGLLAKSQQQADQISAQFTDLEQAMEHVQKNFSGEDERAIKSEVASRFAIRDQARRKREDQNYGTALLEVEQRGQVKPSTFAMLTDGHKAAVLDRQRAEGRQRAMDARGQSVKTDWQLYATLRAEALDEPEKFRTHDVRRYVDRLAGPQLEQLLDMKDKIAKPGPKSRDTATLNQQMSATMKALNIKRDSRRGGQFASYVMEAVDEAAQTKGKALTFEERQKIIDEAVLEGRDPNAFGWTPDFIAGTRRNFELTPEQRKSFAPAPATDAPATEADSLNEALRANGLPQTPENRLRLYQRTMGGTQQ